MITSLSTCLGLLLLFWSSAGAVDLADPAVYNFYFYISTNVQVLNAGIHDENAAKQHWLHHGIDMGLQACGSFHSKQYLAKFDDVRAAFGSNNYRQAIQHYLTSGLHEHRLGYQEGGFEGRWTVSDSQRKLFVSASRRMGAAVDSVVWNNKEFINAWDHGREMQMAMNFIPHGECYNPTEAGASQDLQTNTTHTHITHVHASHHTLETTVQPAFWNLPGSPCHHHTTDNTEATYKHPFSKTVTLSCPGVHTSCLTFESSFTIAGNIPEYSVLQMEAPTGYMTSEFTKFQSVNPDNGHVIPHNPHYPLIMSTEDEHYAMGIYTPPGQDTDLYQYYSAHNFPRRYVPATTNKWNVVFRKNQFAHGSTHVLNYITYVCVGTVHDAVACINHLRATPREQLIG